MTTVAEPRLAPYLTDAATPVEFGADRYVVLTDPRRALLVEQGAMDLFAVLLDGGAPSGRWNYLGRVEQGAILLGLPPGPRHRIVGRPLLGTTVSRLPRAHLERLAEPGADELAARQCVEGVEQGVVVLAQALRDGLPPREFTPLSVTEPTEVEAGAAVRSVDGVRWVRVEEGVVVMPGGVAGHMTAGADICLTQRDWLVGDGPARLRATSTKDLLADGSLWRRLVVHNGRLLYTIDRRIERRNAAERELLRARQDRDAGTLGEAAHTFETVLHDTQAKIRLSDVAADPPALAAVRMVAAHLGFSVRPPVTGSGYDRNLDELQSIALASGVRTRTVRLDGEWWKQDLGPLVGRRKAGDVPVALLPIGGGYVLAEAAKVTPVTAAVAAELKNQGVVLYQPLPGSVRGIGGLLRFGIGNNRRDLWRFALMAVLVAGIGLLVPIMTGAVLGTFVARARRDLIVEGALVVVASAIVVGLLSLVQNIAVLRIDSRSSAKMQAGVWMRLLSLPAAFFSRYSTGELGTTVLGVSAAQEMLSGTMTTATLGLVSGLSNLVLVYFYHVGLALLATVLVLAIGGVTLVAGWVEVRRQRRLYEHEQRLSSRVFQLLSAVPKLRVAAAEDRAFRVWAKDLTTGRALAASSRRVQNAVTTFNATAPVACTAITFAVIGGPLRGQVSITTFLAFFSAFGLLVGAALQFTGAAIMVMGIVPMLERIRPILEAEPEADEFKADPGDLSGRVMLSRVSFRYGEDGPLVLDDVTISAEPGEFVAIVGPSGSGKSTILRLLLGFEAPAGGTVLYDGQDLAELEVSAVRRQCGVVLQNGALLAGDLRANIIGSSCHTDDDAWAAAEMAGIADDISAMPMGMNTVLSEGTNTLSGGQRQRIMIARALVSRPRLVFFDEATSALDNPTQRVVAESTRRLNATRVVIAHRLSTVADADKIVVLDRGKVVQQGRYTDLLADHTGLFARLARRQMA